MILDDRVSVQMCGDSKPVLHSRIQIQRGPSRCGHKLSLSGSPSRGTTVSSAFATCRIVVSSYRFFLVVSRESVFFHVQSPWQFSQLEVVPHRAILSPLHFLVFVCVPLAHMSLFNFSVFPFRSFISFVFSIFFCLWWFQWKHTLHLHLFAFNPAHIW